MISLLSGEKHSLRTLITVLTVAAIALLFIPGALLVQNTFETKLVHEQLGVIDRVNAAWTSALNLRLDHAKKSIQRFSEQVSALPVMTSDESIHSFDTQIRPSGDGSWRSDRAFFSPREEAGIWIPRTRTVAPEAKDFFIRAKHVTEVFGQGALSLFVDTWILPKDGGIVIFWPDEPEWIYDADNELDYTSTEWVTLTRPDINPDGSPQWTGASYDPAPGVWMLSIVAPFYRKGDWAGAVGHDFPISTLARQMDDLTIYRGTDRFLVRRDGTVLISPRFSTKIRESGGRFRISDIEDPFLNGFFEASANGPDRGQGFPDNLAYDDNRIFMIRHVAETDWFFITMVGRDELLETVRRSYRALWALGGVGLVLLASILALIISRVVVPPVNRLVRGIEAVTDGDLYYRFENKGSKEFRYISGALNAMVREIAASIDEIRHKKASLMESEERFRSLFQMAPLPLVEVTKNGRFIEFNRRFTEVLGYTLEEVPTLAQWWEKAYPDPEYRARTVEAWQDGVARAFRENTHIRGTEYRVTGKDGSVHTMIIGASVIVDRLLVSLFDITERKQAEAEHKKLQDQLTQSQKLEAVGILAGGVAHDFNNMLGAIIGYAELTMDTMDAENPFRENLERILDAANRSASLTRQLLIFARKEAVTPMVLDINQSIETTLSLLRRLIGENIELSWQPSEELFTVKMDPTQLDQILANLCINARDAIGDIGTITITAGHVVFDDMACSHLPDCRPGDYVLIGVSDNGCGMDRGTMAHMFEPFFTTKGLGRGTGLGLSTIYGIVKQNEGFINVYSEPGVGTTFKIYIPRYLAEDGPEIQESDEELPLGNGETILMVEDDPVMLDMGQTMLKHLGYTVLPAHSPTEAIRLAGDASLAFQLVLTDVVMPEINGRDLIDRLITIRPGLRHLFMSGYTADIILHRGISDEAGNFIQKPFSLKDVAVKIRQALIA